jgi:hypothetical protein
MSIQIIYCKSYISNLIPVILVLIRLSLHFGNWLHFHLQINRI